jgi:hypothetical protein
MENSILVGYCYHPQQGPCLKIDTIEGATTGRKTVPIWQQYLRFDILDKAYCIGGYDQVSHQATPCPGQQLVSPNQTQCYFCQQSNWFNPAFYHLDPTQLTDAQKNYNLQPHSVYLAYFYKDVIKVGIAYTKRLYLRWLEQGARAAVGLIDMPDAYQARALEKQISKTWAIPEQIRNSKKQLNLHPPYNTLNAHDQLVALRSLIHREIKNVEPSNPIVDLQEAYFYTQEPPTLYTAATTAYLLIEGYGIGLVGNQLVCQQDSHHFVQPLQPLMGRARVTLAQSSNQQGHSPALQTALALHQTSS